jgi:hypothetical protein
VGEAGILTHGDPVVLRRIFPPDEQFFAQVHLNEALLHSVNHSRFDGVALHLSRSGTNCREMSRTAASSSGIHHPNHKEARVRLIFPNQCSCGCAFRRS